MKKQIVMPFLAFLMLTLLAVPAFTAVSGVAQSAAAVRVLLNGSRLSFDVQPQLQSGRVMVPMRAVFQALGCQVVWDEQRRQVIAVRSGNSLVVTPGVPAASRNGVAIPLDAAPIHVQGRILVPLRFVAEALDNTVSWQAKDQTVRINTRDLPVVGSVQKLQWLLSTASYQDTRTLNGVAIGQTEAAAEKSLAPSAAMDGAGDDFSQTNVQVAGVDEADLVKTDGRYLYQVNGPTVKIIRALPADSMTVQATLSFSQEAFTPLELYVDDRFLVVIGSNLSQDVPVPLLPEKQADMRIMPPYYRLDQVTAYVYDRTDMDDIRRIRTLTLDGSYVSSRKIGSQLYLVTTKFLDGYRIMGDAEGPGFADSATGNRRQVLSWQDVRYFPGQVRANVLLVGGADLTKGDQSLAVSAFLGAGENIYATSKNLYVAVTNPAPYVSTVDPTLFPRWPQTETALYRFALADGKASYSQKGQVPGTLLNQFSMDEGEGYFRLATTVGESWWSGEAASQNNLYILDSQLATVGKIENIAPGEKIYAARFLGDRAYMVTFRNVDPLFVIDLSDPRQPRILGALKIPGYSDYLHPYDQNHLIGFGKETVELSQPGWDGGTSDTISFYQGMKVALFDVSDVSRPRVLHQVVIGDRGTDSELLRNHKALLFNGEKNLLAFPVTLMEVADRSTAPDGFPAYGQFTYQGAYVYNLDLAGGFQLRGRISHLSQEDLLQSGSYWSGSPRHLDRILYIGDTLYTLSQGLVKANDLASLRELGQLDLTR